MIKFCTNAVVSQEDQDLILNSLPTEWKTEVMYFCAEKNKEVHIKINAKTIEDTLKWLHSFQKLTNTVYSVNSAYNSKGQRVYYKKRYHCHHNTRHKDTYDSVTRTSIKNTKCPSNLIISIRKIIGRYQGKNRPADPKKPCEIKIKLDHNHALDTPDILKFKKVLPEVKEQLLQYFSEGYTASTALKHLKEMIKQNNENCDEIFSDRSQCPDYSYCYYLYLKYQSNLTNSFIEPDESILTDLFEKYNNLTNDISAELAVCEDGNVVCLCPPIAKRVNQHEVYARIVFVDSFASSDSNGNRIILFLTPSEVGCLPLGVIITSNENSTMTRIGLALLKDMLSDTSFGGNSTNSTIFISDEFMGEDSILTSVWPTSQNYLSIFHVLQNVWHWLSNIRNKISLEDRPLLFKDFYNVLYAKTEENFNISFDVALKSAQKYDNYLSLLKTYYNKKEYWALYCRPDELKSDNDTIKYSESTIRFLRSNMFTEFKQFDFVPIVEFITKHFFPYFERRLLDVASNTIPDVFFSNMKQFPAQMVKKIQVLGPNMRLVPSESSPGTYYMINVDLLTCTCPKANSSSICKHVQCVSMVLYQKTFEDSCQNIDIRKKCHLLATGEELPIPVRNEDPLELIEATITNSEYIEDLPQEIHQIDEVMEIDNEDYFEVARNEESRKECKEIWQEISNVFENFIDESSNEFASIISKVASKFEAFDSVADLRSAFNIFEPSQPKRTLKKKATEEQETTILEVEENVENISNYIVQTDN